MPAYLGPPPFPWIPRPANAFNPIRAWFPYDSGGQFRDFVRGDHAVASGSYSWGAGSYGRCWIGAGGLATSGSAIGSPDAITLTVAHYYTGTIDFSHTSLLGWGSGAQGIRYGSGQLQLIEAAGSNRFAATLSPPSAAWRPLTLTLAGHASGSAVAVWSEGSLVASGTLSGALVAPARLTIGALNNAANAWRGGIGQVYLHEGVLPGHQIRRLHADLWRYFRDYRDDTPRKFYSIPPPFAFSGAGVAGAPEGDGEFAFSFAFSGAGASASPEGDGEFGFSWSFAGAGASGDPAGDGEFAFSWAFAGAGTSGAPEGDGEFDWPWVFSGAGVSGEPSGSGAFDWEPPPPPILTLEAVRARYLASPDLLAACPKLWLDQADESAKPPYGVLVHLWAQTEVTTTGQVEVDDERIQISWVGATAEAARNLGELGRSALHFAPLDGGAWPILHCLHEQTVGPVRDPDRAQGQSHCWVTVQEFSILRNRRGDF